MTSPCCRVPTRPLRDDVPAPTAVGEAVEGRAPHIVGALGGSERLGVPPDGEWITNDTLATPDWSVTVALNETCAPTVAPEPGDRLLIVGAVLSPVGGLARAIGLRRRDTTDLRQPGR